MNSQEAAYAALEKVFGKASGEGFGSAVFHGPVLAGSTNEQIAAQHYQQFLGAKWQPDTKDRWMASWKKVYQREAGTKGDVLAELSGIQDPDAKNAIPLLTELNENAEAGNIALAQAFNSTDITNLAVYTIGDGEAMSGILVTGLYKNGEACSVIVLMD